MNEKEQILELITQYELELCGSCKYIERCEQSVILCRGYIPADWKMRIRKIFEVKEKIDQ